MREGTNKRTNEQKSPCVLQDIVPFGAATQKAQKRRKSNKSSKDLTWSAVPVALLGQICLACGVGAGQRPQRADVL